MSQSENSSIRQEIHVLLQSLQSLQLATLNQQQAPEISYTPFIEGQNRYYIFVSELASHTQNLRSNAVVSLLFIEDEASCKNIFARKRLILECDSTQIERVDPQWNTIMEDFEQLRGNTVGVLKSLPDFCLFQLNPKKGSYIKGFGNAYALSGDNFAQIEQVKGTA